MLFSPFRSLLCERGGGLAGSLGGTRGSEGPPGARLISEGQGIWWCPADGSLTVKGHRIRGGLLYVGESRFPGRTSTEVSLVDPKLNIGTPKGALTGLRLPVNEPVSYSNLSWGARAAYLQWLAEGRTGHEITPGLLLTYLSGLERRVLRLLADRPEDLGDLVSVREEVRRLERHYRYEGFFGDRARGLLELISYLVEHRWRNVEPGEGALLSGGAYRTVNPALPVVRYGRPPGTQATVPTPAPAPAVERPAPAVERPAPAVGRPDAPRPAPDTATGPPVPQASAPPASEPLAPLVPAPSAPEPPVSEPLAPESGTATARPGPEKAGAAADATGFFDREHLTRVQAETRQADALLQSYFTDDEDETGTFSRAAVRPGAAAPVPRTAPEPDAPAADAPHLLLLRRLAARERWSRDEARELARRSHVMLDAAIDLINDHADERVEAPVIEVEDDDSLVIDAEVLAELDLEPLELEAAAPETPAPAGPAAPAPVPAVAPAP
ncbi:TerB N-terminal domain-containing protein, partial [Nocardiopsis protaetiae]